MRDEEFIRGRVPMTKSEVRAVSISKLELAEGEIVYDIGAGTGSVAVEMAMTTRCGHVYAVEYKKEACELIRRNREHFHVDNLTVVEGEAPGILEGMPGPDKVFIGGSKGKLQEIFDWIWNKNPDTRVVINAATLETLASVSAYLQEHKMEAEIVCVQVAKARKLGDYHLMEGQNPVYIVTIEPPGVGAVN
ncbi:MAG: precorrin-6Y C5,15-methyltransferase (decarboxylating) subunit CbiT [Lachnospiraceae bacterium]|jgi:precorrin-6Y C5,15-methyltransferase (decarboxylating)|nr:precorrin-6Y C5,15-methyltransferase (decarboxylating) subunit CbiT [Lachnospiraceae bacterium]